jgi:hypothetical protein
MLAGVHAVGKTACLNSDHSTHYNTITCGLALAVTVILFAKRINPALLMLVGGAVGWFVLLER